MITALRRRIHADEPDRGGITLMTVVLAPVMILFLWGLVVDGGGLLAAKQEANHVAEDAARAAGQEIIGPLAARGIDTVVAPIRATSAAKIYLAEAGVEGDVIPTGPRTLTVNTRVVYTPTLLPLGTSVVTGQATVNLNRTNAGEVSLP